jgi:hypothetical protein
MNNGWSTLLHSLSSQAGIWFVGFVIAMLSVFSGRIVESIKFGLNRADLGAKYYEEIATQISHFIFIVDRYIKVFHSSWINDDDRNAISVEYNGVTNSIRRKEYVYRSWMHRYWGKKRAAKFSTVLDKIGAVDAALIRIGALDATSLKKNLPAYLGELKDAHRELSVAAEALLAP